MNSLVSMIFMILFLCSCAGSGQQKIVNVPEQDVSFISPPSSWKKLYFSSTSQMPTGESIPTKMFIAAWRKSNYSSIGISGGNMSGTTKKISSKGALRFGLEKDVDEVRKSCRDVRYYITDEKSGILRSGIIFAAIEAEIICSSSGFSSKDKVKTILYALQSSDYYYTLQLKTMDKNYDKDIIVFEKILDTISFGESKPIRTIAISPKTYIEIRQDENIFNKRRLLMFRAQPGDNLLIIQKETCVSGRYECWVVQNEKTGETGYVRAQDMISKHNVSEVETSQ